eukprot:gene1690-biopygen9489
MRCRVKLAVLTDHHRAAADPQSRRAAAVRSDTRPASALRARRSETRGLQIAGQAAVLSIIAPANSSSILQPRAASRAGSAPRARPGGGAKCGRHDSRARAAPASAHPAPASVEGGAAAAPGGAHQFPKHGSPRAATGRLASARRARPRTSDDAASDGAAAVTRWS